MMQFFLFAMYIIHCWTHWHLYW